MSSFVLSMAVSSLRSWRRTGVLIAVLSFGEVAQAQPLVETLGGGRLAAHEPDAGFVDGDILQTSQFHNPAGAAVDALGHVYITDRNNGALRKLDLAENRSRTLLAGLNQPVAVAVNGTNMIFVLTRGDGRITQVDPWGQKSVIASGLIHPSALALDGNDTLYVTESGGRVLRIHAVTRAMEVLRQGLSDPRGIAVLGNGNLAVSEAGLHRVLFLNPTEGNTLLVVGTGVPGFSDGPANLAQFNRPEQIAKAPNGGLVVADGANHRVRIVSSEGIVTTLYGVDPDEWEGPACTHCVPMILPGWLDGTVKYAEARDPVGVAVSASGVLYTTEAYYHIVRRITGLALAGETSSLVVQPPVISPDSGYWPMGQNISVLDPNAATDAQSAVYYTLDGSEPTTSSLRLNTAGGVGIIPWRESQRDLRSLRLKTFLGGASSDSVAGKAVETSTIGVPRDLRGGIGSTVILPLVVNLRTNDLLRSLQFRVEVSPVSPGAPIIPDTFAPLPVSTNDFIRLVTSTENRGASKFEAAGYAFGNTRGLVITFIGTNSNFSVRDFAAVAMLAVPIPTTASLGDRYRISVVNPSGTADGFEAEVPLAPLPAREILVAEVSYRVGDSSPGTWYNADGLAGSDPLRFGFGDGRLSNSDVNNAFAAALGQRVPYRFSDLFDAMDVFPEDTADRAGGDGMIRFLDWQLILLRSLGLDTSEWVRSWRPGGSKAATGGGHSGLANTAAEMWSAAGPGAVWNREVLLQAESQSHVQPGSVVNVPVRVKVASGARLAGMAFRAVLETSPGAPSPVLGMQFSPSLVAPGQLLTPSADVLLCGWSLVPAPAFSPALEGTVLLGHIQVPIPASAPTGARYVIRFAMADGSPDLQTQYNFETQSAVLAVGAAAPGASVLSDEWKAAFFGHSEDPRADADADPDGDGVPNHLEYLAGTHPNDPASYLRLDSAVSDPQRGGMVLRWLSAPGRLYTLEASSEFGGSAWTTLVTGLSGTGYALEWVDAAQQGQIRFYRLRVQP